VNTDVGKDYNPFKCNPTAKVAAKLGLSLDTAKKTHPELEFMCLTLSFSEVDVVKNKRLATLSSCQPIYNIGHLFF